MACEFNVSLMESGDTFNVTFRESPGVPSDVRELTVTENGDYDAGENAAFNPVHVRVPEPSGAIEIALNGTYDVSEYAEANVDIPQPTGTKTITANGTHDVSDYAEADVQVPNSYDAADEGKVVLSGALVAQTVRTVTANGQYDTTENNVVTVDVPKSCLGRNVKLHMYEVTVGENTVSNTSEFVNYLYSLTGRSGNLNTYNLIIGLLDEIELVNNMIVGTGFYDDGSINAGSLWRYRNGTIGRTSTSTAYDAVAIEGTHYFVCLVEGDASI